MVARSLTDGLVIPRCRQCSNILEFIPAWQRRGCWCERGICISCNASPATKFSLCDACNGIYQWQFHPRYYRPDSAPTLAAWLRKRFSNLLDRHGVLGSFDEFWEWFHRAHQSFRLWFQVRYRKFVIHRANDVGRYRVAEEDRNIFMIPYGENNIARSFCRIDKFDRVLELHAKGYTFPDILDRLSVSFGTAHRWINGGLQLPIHEKVCFLKYPPRPA